MIGRLKYEKVLSHKKYHYQARIFAKEGGEPEDLASALLYPLQRWQFAGVRVQTAKILVSKLQQ